MSLALKNRLTTRERERERETDSVGYLGDAEIQFVSSFLSALSLADFEKRS